MRIQGLFRAFTMFCLAAAVAPAAMKTIEIKSPDGHVVLTFALNKTGEPIYTVSYRGQPVIAESRLGLSFKDAPGLERGFALAAHATSSEDTTWTPVAAERSPIHDHFNAAEMDLRDSLGRRLQLTFRIYDEGVAFRYTLPRQAGLKDFTITSEVTEFAFTGDHLCWPVYTAQAQYKPGLRLADVKPKCERPLTVEIPGGPALAVGEAALIDYARMKLQPAGRPHTLKAQLDGPVTGTAPFSSPWRFVMLADTPGQLLERNHLVLNLNEPSRIEDISWIKPGKVIREVTLTTAGGKACVDFALRQGIQYVEYDAGWYGYEYDPRSDARAVNLDARRSKGPLDLQAVIDYANGKGIGIILYVNHLALERQADEIFPLYHKWGVKGVKFGFVNVGSQQWTRWVFEHVKKAADNRLMVDIHDEYRQTGISRTLPNLMTTEGVGGDEEFPPAEHVTALPFTRALCGTFDNTICMYSQRLTKTRCFQLAKAVVVFSPWQFIYWYDRPEAYQGEPELEFWKSIPTVWDETRVIHGVIGRYVTEARRSGREWHVGSLNAGQRRTLEIPLTFLEPGVKYDAWIYSDGAPAGGDLTKVAIERRMVDATTVIKADMAADGGHAMRLAPRP